ncbi:hypothetical protein [Methylobacterium sp. CM6244]
MGLIAKLREGVLKITGDPVQAGSQFQVSIDYNKQVSISDNGPSQADVAVKTDGSLLDRVMLDEAGGPARVYSYGNSADIRGSDYNDSIYLFGYGSSYAAGGRGNDYLVSSGSADRLSGGLGHDQLVGGGGNDILNGGAGDDSLDGGDGFDIAAYNGNRSDFKLTTVGDHYVLNDLRSKGPEGTDNLYNIEQLRFKDGLVDLRAPSTDLTATLREGVLKITGDPVQAGSQFQVSIDYNKQVSISDNGPSQADVAVKTDGSLLDRVMLDEAGGPARVYSYGNSADIRGSDYNDSIYLFGYGSSYAAGGRGNDYLVSSGSADRLSGGLGHDQLVGGGGNDILNGGAGDDSLDGGDGFDIAAYNGNRSDFKLTTVGDHYVLNDLRSKGPEGTDNLYNIEQLRFKDGLVDLRAPSTDLTATLREGVLKITGDPVQAGSQFQVSIDYNKQVSISDNGPSQADVAVKTDGSLLDRVMLDEAGGPARVYSYGNSADIRGSDYNDSIYLFGYGSSYAAGGRGNDYLVSSGSADRLSGGLGHDQLVGGGGNDILNGGAGDDSLDGGDGFDIAAYNGNRSDFKLTTVGDHYVLNDLRSKGPEGTDNLYNIEQLRFQDGILDL